MAKVFLGLGSNIQPRHHIQQALLALRETFGANELSSVYESEPVGFEGENFLNLAASVTTGLTVGELQACLREIENTNGRDRNSSKFSGRTLDIDILLYDDLVGVVDGVTLPRDEILKNAFVLKPLCDLIPKLIHPTANKTIAQLWKEYDKSRQKLWSVDSAEIFKLN